MDGYYPMAKLKRKEIDEVNEDFSDFSLSSPARKIRRLDAELPPIIEEEEPEIPVEFEQSLPEQNFGSNARRGLVIEELPDVPENEERALVLFKPKHAPPLLSSPSSYSVSIDPQLISGFKNQALWSNQSRARRAPYNEVEEPDKNFDTGKRCLAVVPWVPALLPSSTKSEAFPETDLADMMEAEDLDGSTMEIEDGDAGFNQGMGVNVNEGVHQWQQQHCMIPQPPQSASTPVVWFR